MVLLFLVAGTQYFIKNANELCVENEMISSQEECSTAILELKNLGLDITFSGTSGSNKMWPKGCYRHTVDKFGYWNSDESGSENSNARPICKG